MERPKRKISVPVVLARSIRLAKGLTQADAAERHGVSAALVSAIENGTRPGEVYAEYLQTLAEAPNKRDRTPGGEYRAGKKRA